MKTPPFITDMLALIDRWLAYRRFIQELPGLSIGISLAGQRIFLRHYGYADLEKRVPAGPDTLYRIASHSKLFTATAVMRLQAAGLLHLDDPVGQHVDWFSASRGPGLDQVTLRRLLTHSSGVNRDGDTHHWSYDAPFPDRTSLQRQVSAGISVFPPDETWKYSNMGFALLGQVIEAVTGKTFEEAVMDLVVRPLHLKNTLPDYSAELAGRFATGHSRKFPGETRRPFDPIPTRAMSSAAGFSSTVEDLLAFYDAHTMGITTLLSDDEKRLMQQVHFQDSGIEWGLGFALRRVGKFFFAGHGGRLPGFLSFSGLNQEHGLAIAVMTNAIDGQAREIFTGVSNLLYRVLESGQDFQGEGLPVGRLQPAAGFYHSLFGVELYGQVGDKLVGLNPDLLDPEAEMDVFEQVGPLQFKIPGRDQVGPAGELITFVRNPDGDIESIFKPGKTASRFHFAG